MSVFKRYSYWINSGKYTAIQKFSVLIMGIVSFMLLARSLGPEGFGVWGLFMVISATVETTRISLIKNAFIRFMYQTEKHEQDKLQSAAFVLSAAISLIISLAFLILANPIGTWLKAESLSVMLQWYALTIMVSLFFSHFEMLLNAKMNFKGICWMYCWRQGILVLLITLYVVFKLPLGAFHLSMFYLASVLIGSAVGLYFSYPYLKLKFDDLRSWISRLVSFGKYVFGNNLCSQLFRSTDNFITATYFGPSVTAFYNSCLRIGNLVDMPSQVFGDILFPKAAKYNSNDKESIKNLYEKSVGAILIFSLPVLTILLLIPSFVLKVLAGDQYIAAAPILRITALVGFILPFMKQFGTIMDATGRPDISFKIMLLALCINIFANFTGVHFWGIMGAAYGTIFTYSCIFIVAQIILYRMFKIHLGNIFRNTISFCGEIIASRKKTLKELV